MGFSLSGARVIYFITIMIIAGLVSGIIVSVATDTSESLCNREERIQNELDLDFIIINDPFNIPLTSNGNFRLFYLKNIGEKKFISTNDTFQIFLNGEMLSKTSYNFSVSTLECGKVSTIYIASSQISYGDHIMKIFGPQALNDEFVFTI